MQRPILAFVIAVVILESGPVHAQQRVFSGPQAGERLPPLKVTAAFNTDQSEDYDLVTRAGGKPILLVFLHDLLTNPTDEPSLGLAYILMQYAAERQDTGLARGIVCTTDDVTALRAFLTKIRRVFPKRETPIGISPDGLEGPGDYGLNRGVRMTILIAKDNEVTASFALTQPSVRADAPRILAELVKVIGGKPPQLWQLDFPYYVTPFSRSKIITTRGGVHSTTRGTIRLVARHQDNWLVFHGGPNTVQFSPDGARWTKQKIAHFDSRNHLIRGDTIYSFAHVSIERDRGQQEMISTAFQGTIHGKTIDWGQPHRLPHLTLSYYQDLQQDSQGHFTVSGRVLHRDENGKPAGMTIEWARSVRPNDISQWGRQQKVIHHVSDMRSSEAHENLPLEDGKTYVIGMLSVGGEGRLYGNLFDGRKWREQDTLLAENMSTVRGSDKRMSAVWDPGARVIQLAYVDHDSQLWYRTCKSPYAAEDWTAPVKLKPFKVFTNVISLDTSQTPARVCLLYGKTEFEHPDPRWQSGSLFLTKFDGKSWSDPVIVSEPGTKLNWYPNMNEDASQGLGVVYLKGVPKNQAAVEQTDFDIMFATNRSFPRLDK